VLQRSPSPDRRLASRLVLSLVAALAAAPAPSEAASLQPTRAGLLRQAQGARDHGFDHLANEDEVHDFVRRGLLVSLRGNADYYIHPGVRYAVARPEVKLFVERLSQQYRASCGEKLVVTSLMRPKDRQPANSHELSVHPTGMALDLRVSNSSRCRAWLEGVLVDLEGKGVLEAARERRPPHYHVVVFPRDYARYVAGQGGTVQLAAAPAVTAVAQTTAKAAAPAQASTPAAARYRVRSGDSLWAIARRHDTSVAALRAANGLRSSQLKPGQVLRLPAR
jgi:hypothetical protein